MRRNDGQKCSRKGSRAEKRRIRRKRNRDDRQQQDLTGQIFILSFAKKVATT
jgi:hypothetical protein